MHSLHVAFVICPTLPAELPGAARGLICPAMSNQLEDKIRLYMVRSLLTHSEFARDKRKYTAMLLPLNRYYEGKNATTFVKQEVNTVHCTFRLVTMPVGSLSLRLLVCFAAHFLYLSRFQFHVRFVSSLALYTTCKKETVFVVATYATRKNVGTDVLPHYT